MWVCAGGGCGFVLISLIVFFFSFFFFEVALVDVGLCRWWLSVLLPVVAVGDDDDDSDRDREEEVIYYFNV